MHYFEHSWDDLLQDICLVAYDLICDLVCQWHHALQSIEKAQRDLVIFVLFFQELNGQVLSLDMIRQW